MIEKSLQAYPATSELGSDDSADGVAALTTTSLPGAGLSQTARRAPPVDLALDLVLGKGQVD